MAKHRIASITLGWIVAALAVGAHFIPYGVLMTLPAVVFAALVWTAAVVICPLGIVHAVVEATRATLRGDNSAAVHAAVAPATVRGTTSGALQERASPSPGGEATEAVPIHLCDECLVRPAIGEPLHWEEFGGELSLRYLCRVCRAELGHEVSTESSGSAGAKERLPDTAAV